MGVRRHASEVSAGSIVMSVAAIYDIHGNLPALEAVLAAVREAGASRLVVGGDVIPGPMPRESIAAILSVELPVHFVCGNGEREVLARLDGVDTGTVPARFREVIDWVGAQLPPEYVDHLADWPQTTELRVEGVGDVLFCHATPRSDIEIFTRLTPDDRIEPIFASVAAGTVVCGHTHMQFDRKVGDVRVVNAGSVGMPFGEGGAHWLLLGPGVEHRRTEYDLSAAADRIRATRYPHAEQFVMENVLTTPDASEMVELFERSASGS